MIRPLMIALAFASPAHAAGLQEAMRASCLQEGLWKGQIEIVDAAGKSNRVQLISRQSCTPDGRYHMVQEDFISAKRSDHTVKVSYLDEGIQGFRTAYFAQGKETPYQFRFVRVDIKSPTDWVQVVETPPPGELFDGRPAILRYTREMRGDLLISRKEVRFLEGGPFETRSLTEQRRVSAEEKR